MRYDNSCKFRLYPTKEQKVLIGKTFGCCRFLYNWALAMKKKEYEDNKVSLSCFDLNKKLTELKKEEQYSWLKEVDAKALIYTIANMDTAYKNFFKLHRGYPKFKSKYDNNKSYQTYQSTIRVNYKTSKILLPKLGWVKCVFSKNVLGAIKTCTISCNPSGEYYVSMIVESKSDYPTLKEIRKENALGIDMGIKNLAILSDGTKYDSCAFLRKSQSKLARLQRSLSRKKKGSSNYEKQRIKVAKCHQKISNKRNNFINNIVADITSKGYDTICIEDLNIKGMTKNHRLAKSINDASMGSFNVKLTSKCQSKGINIIKIDRYAPSSKKCHSCGYIYKELKLSQRSWTCPICGETHDRDINAAINIKEIGVSSLPKCTRNVKSVECRKQKQKNAKCSDVSDTKKQEKERELSSQIPNIQDIIQNEIYIHTE